MTLVQCWNVNGGGGVQQCALPTPEAPVNDGSNYNCLKVGKAAFIKSSSFALNQSYGGPFETFLSFEVLTKKEGEEGDYMLETPGISEYFDTMIYQSENLWSADNQQATRSKIGDTLEGAILL